MANISGFVELELKRDFDKACERRGLIKSAALRNAIETYIKEQYGEELEEVE